MQQSSAVGLNPPLASHAPIGASATMPDSLPASSPAPSDRLANEDLLPVQKQTWGAYSFFALWMSDVHSLGGYVFAAGLFFLGLAGWQILLSMLIGILIVNALLNFVGKIGQQTGAPFPVLARLSFGVFGANLPALIRAAVGIVWYGVQTWLGSLSLVILVEAVWPDVKQTISGEWLGLSSLGWLCFMAMWSLQQFLFWRGIERIRRFIDFCGPAVYVVMFVLAGWMLSQAGWSAFTLKLGNRELTLFQTLREMSSVVALVIAYFAALLLNFADFSRFGVSEQAVRRGNFLGLPINFMLFAVVTVIITASTVVVFGKAILDPIEVIREVPNKPALIVGCLTLVIATIGINIVANFVSAAYDIANVAPRHISFVVGGFITSVLIRRDASLAALQQPRHHQPVCRRARSVSGSVVRHHDRRLLFHAPPPHRDRRSVQRGSRGPLLVPGRRELARGRRVRARRHHLLRRGADGLERSPRIIRLDDRNPAGWRALRRGHAPRSENVMMSGHSPWTQALRAVL